MNNNKPKTGHVTPGEFIAGQPILILNERTMINSQKLVRFWQREFVLVVILSCIIIKEMTGWKCLHDWQLPVG